MKCPYCQTEVADEVLACPHCTKDLYLFKPMMARVSDLESQLCELPERKQLLERVAQLEEMPVLAAQLNPYVFFWSCHWHCC